MLRGTWLNAQGRPSLGLAICYFLPTQYKYRSERSNNWPALGTGPRSGRIADYPHRAAGVTDQQNGRALLLIGLGLHVHGSDPRLADLTAVAA